MDCCKQKDRMQTKKKDSNKKGSANYKENGIMPKGMGGGLAQRSESKPQNIYPKIAIFKKCQKITP